ncbi:uncharacterized protein VTP21DRAFT_6668 [Calcarisporiella thermophila]|uniref:uncharacterized protein n=1 Tax=Calcarisporiella thermophila TaxID=911321 RepID=UPI003742DBB4
MKTLLLVTSLFAGVLAQNAGFPPIGGDLPAQKEWAASIDASKIPDVSVQSVPPQCGADDKHCHWTCTTCTRPSDIVSCPKGYFGLTFDDGPTEFSPRLYDFLKQQNIKATFFILGSRAANAPEMIKRIHADGHEIASHTYSHRALTSLSNEQIIAEMKWTEKAIEQAIGIKPTLMRPPYGDIDDRVRAIMTALGYKAVIWNKDSNDWRLQEKSITREEINGNFSSWVQEAPNASTGPLCLQHDHSTETVDIAIDQIPRLKNAYKLVTVGTCISGGSGTSPTSTVTATSSSSAAASTSPLTAASAQLEAAKIKNHSSASISSYASNGIVKLTALISILMLFLAI